MSGLSVSGLPNCLVASSLNPLDFSVWSFLQEKVQATPHKSLAALRPTQVWRPYAGPSPGSGTGCRRPTSAGPAALSAAAWSPSWRKMAAISNRSVRKRSTHTNQPCSGLPKASIRDEGLFFEKNHFSPRFSAPPCMSSLSMGLACLSPACLGVRPVCVSRLPTIQS
jgi:hypothetical protein